MGFKVGDRVQIKMTVEHPELYPGAAGTVVEVGESTMDFIRVRVDHIRPDDEIGLELADEGWLYADNELEAI